MKTKVCPVCGVTFVVRPKHPDTKTCSHRCGTTLRRGDWHAKFWEKVDQSGGPDACWPWTLRRVPFGYGMTYYGDCKNTYSHRLAWEITNGPIPPGLYVLHRCDNPGCCNPRHLFLGTYADNAADRHAKGRSGNHKGQANGRANLTEDDVCAIRRGVTMGAKQVEMARQFGVPAVTVNHIIRRRTWAHVVCEGDS